ncbi:MAG: YceI family protein [Acidobacteria bacterium]|nr:YceI family protein [Acidobacteriota bacterium]
MSRTHAFDPAHSEVTFQVRHLITKVSGRFSSFAGTIQFDDAAPAQSSVSVTVQTASIDTTQSDRDAHLRSDEFFSVERFPTMTFVSRSITPAGGHFDVAGDLTIRDITRPVVFPVTYLGTARDPWGNDKLAFESALTINRKDFGLTWNAALETDGVRIGEDVKISLNLQAAVAN